MLVVNNKSVSLFKVFSNWSKAPFIKRSIYLSPVSLRVTITEKHVPPLPLSRRIPIKSKIIDAGMFNCKSIPRLFCVELSPLFPAPSSKATVRYAIF